MKQTLLTVADVFQDCLLSVNFWSLPTGAIPLELTLMGSNTEGLQ